MQMLTQDIHWLSQPTLTCSTVSWMTLVTDLPAIQLRGPKPLTFILTPLTSLRARPASWRLRVKHSGVTAWRTVTRYTSLSYEQLTSPCSRRPLPARSK